MLELRARARTSGALRALLGLAPTTARRLRDDGGEDEQGGDETQDTAPGELLYRTLPLDRMRQSEHRYTFGTTPWLGVVAQFSAQPLQIRAMGRVATS